MKLYVVPVENNCNADCLFCTTKFKNDKEFGNLLDISDLLQINSMEVKKIEITGGGDPFLHPKIDRIINYCVKKAPTQIYTNAALLNPLKDAGILRKLSYLCISRSHYDETANKRIMGIHQNVNINYLAKSGVLIKLSLVMCRSGITNADDLKKFLDWSKQKGIKKVVIRRLFNFEKSVMDNEYKKIFTREFVSVDNLHKQLGIINYYSNVYGNIIFDWNWMEVEIENRSCACEIKHPVLRGNGKMYFGWGKKLWKKQA